MDEYIIRQLKYIENVKSPAALADALCRIADWYTSKFNFSVEDLREFLKCLQKYIVLWRKIVGWFYWEEYPAYADFSELLDLVAMLRGYEWFDYKYDKLERDSQGIITEAVILIEGYDSSGRHETLRIHYKEGIVELELVE